jgi:hypothetical protein
MRKAILFAALTLLLITPAVHSEEDEKKDRYFLRLDALLATGLNEMHFGLGYMEGSTVTSDWGLGAAAVGGIENRRSRIEFGVTWLSFRYSEEVRNHYLWDEPPTFRYDWGSADVLNLHVAFLFSTASRGTAGWVFGPMLGWKAYGDGYFDGTGFSYGLRLGYVLPKGSRNQIEIGMQYFNMPIMYDYHSQENEFSFLTAQVGLRFGRKD